MVESSYLKNLLGAQVVFNFVLILILVTTIAISVWLLVYLAKRRIALKSNDIEKNNAKNDNKQAIAQTLNTLKEVIKIESEKNQKMYDYMDKNLAAQKLKESSSMFNQTASALNQKNQSRNSTDNKEDKTSDKQTKQFTFKNLFRKSLTKLDNDSLTKLEAKPLSSRNLKVFNNKNQDLKEKDEEDNKLKLNESLAKNVSSKSFDYFKLKKNDIYDEHQSPFTTDKIISNDIPSNPFEVDKVPSVFNFKNPKRLSYPFEENKIHQDSFPKTDNILLQNFQKGFNLNPKLKHHSSFEPNKSNLKDGDFHLSNSSESESEICTSQTSTETLTNQDISYMPNLKQLKKLYDQLSHSSHESKNLSQNNKFNLEHLSIHSINSNDSSFLNLNKTKSKFSEETIFTRPTSQLTFHPESTQLNETKNEFSYESLWTTRSDLRNCPKTHASNLIHSPIRQSDSSTTDFYAYNDNITNEDKRKQFLPCYLKKNTSCSTSISNSNSSSSSSSDSTNSSTSSSCCSSSSNSSKSNVSIDISSSEEKFEMMPTLTQFKRKNKFESLNKEKTRKEEFIMNKTYEIPYKKSVSNKLNSIQNHDQDVSYSAASLASLSNASLQSAISDDTHLCVGSSPQSNTSVRNDQDQVIILKLKGNIEFV